MDDPLWTAEHIKSCIKWGPHPSTNLHDEFLHDKYADFIEAGFWVVLPLAQVQALNKDLRLSPMAIKVKHNRHPRVIVDHTWFSVNDHTVLDLPHEVMQFSGTLPWILWLLWHADPSAGPVYLSKYDIMDGFYHVFLKADDALQLAVMMPSYDNEPPLLAIPLSLTMGWTNSPPTFCAVSETAADLANNCIADDTPLLTHHMEPMASVHDAWANTLQHRQSTINMLGDPLVPTSGDPLVPTTGDPLVSMLGAPVPHPGDLLVPTLGDPLVSTGQSTSTMLGALVLPPCHLAPSNL